MRKVDTPADELLASYPDDVRGALEELDALIRAALPGRSRTVWEGRFWGGTDQRIVAYGDIVQPRPRGETTEWVLVGLARQSKAYSIYVNAVEDGAYLLAKYAERLGRVKVGSASISIRSIDDVDRDALAELLCRAHEITPPDA